MSTFEVDMNTASIYKVFYVKDPFDVRSNILVLPTSQGCLNVYQIKFFCYNTLKLNDKPKQHK